MLERAASIGILLSALLVVAYCVWTLNRGFEITDEAYYLLLAMHADSVKVYISAQQWITSGIWEVTGSLVLFRAAGLLVLLLSSALLSSGVFSAGLRLGIVADNLQSRSVVFAGTAVSALLYASTINLSPCYNLLAAAGAYAAAGAVLLASNRSNLYQKNVLFALSGISVGVEAICKASAGIATLAICLIWAVYFEKARSAKLIGPVVMCLAVAATVGIAMIINTSPRDALQALDQGMFLFRMVQTETMDARLFRYLAEFLDFCLQTVRQFLIPIVLFLFFLVTKRQVLAVLGLVALLILLVVNGSFLGGVNRYTIQMIALFAMTGIALLSSFPVWGQNRGAIVLFVGLIVLPYSVAMGTGNALFTQVIDSLAPWGALMSMLLAAVDSRKDVNRAVVALVGFLFVSTIMSQIVTSSIRPYHLSMPLHKQTISTEVARLGTVSVDSKTYNFLEATKEAIVKCDIVPGTPFIGLYNIPGLALALEAVPPLTPWLNNKVQAEYVIERLSTDEFRSAVVVIKLESDGTLPQLPKQMGLFPSGYIPCGTAMYPYQQQQIQFWRLQNQQI